MRYELCKFGFDRLLIKGTLLEEQINLLAVFRISPGGVLKINTSHSPRMRYKQHRFRCDVSLNTGTLLI